MAIDGFFTYKLALELNDHFSTGKINHIYELNKTDFIFEIRKQKENKKLYISLNSQTPCLFLSNKDYDKPYNPYGFCMFLRKHLESGFIVSIESLSFDRIIEIKIAKNNEMGDREIKNLIIEMIGRYSNLILCDENYKIIDSLKHISVLEAPRGIMNGAIYNIPETDKIIPTEVTDNISFEINPRNIMDNIKGISPILADFLYNSYLSNSSLTSSINLALSSYSPAKKGNDFYYFNLFKDEDKKYETISSLLEDYLKDIITKSSIKDYNNKIFKTVKSNLNRIEKKEKKLLEELDKTKERDKYKLYGELLLAHQYLKPVDNSVKVINYYNNEEVSIPIDKSKSINYNSQAYYKKYRKLKNAVSHLTEQLELTKKEKIYFEEIKNSFEHASIRDIEEITIDLENNNYLIKNNKNKRKIKEYNYDVYEFEDYIIYVGKNHLQNDYITNKLAKPNDLWFHVKNGAGSHVVARGLDLEREEIIRNASLLASYYSSYKESSSVPVDYTYIKNIKKVPGIKGFFVTYTKEKTIYIDPRKEILEELKQFKKK